MHTALLRRHSAPSLSAPRCIPMGLPWAHHQALWVYLPTCSPVPPHGLHPRLSLIPSVPVPFPAALPILQKLAAPSPSSGLCTALCLCSAHSCPNVAPQSWHQLQCPPCAHMPTLRSACPQLHQPPSPCWHAHTPCCSAPHSSSLLGMAPSGGGDFRVEEWAGGSRVQQPDPVGSLSPHVLGSESCSLFLVVHQPQLSLLSSASCLSHPATAALPLG